MPSSITRLTTHDHERLLRLVRRACSPGPSQERWRSELVQLARSHLVAERSVLQPEVVAAGGPEAQAALDDLRRIDQGLEEATRSLEATVLGSPDVEAAGAALRSLVVSHSELLADRLLAHLVEALPRKELRRLGGEYERHRDEALLADGAAEPPPRRLDLSRAELYELAKRAGIEGRSSMSRRDLIVELQRRQQTQ